MTNNFYNVSRPYDNDCKYCGERNTGYTIQPFCGFFCQNKYEEGLETIKINESKHENMLRKIERLEKRVKYLEKINGINNSSSSKSNEEM